MKLKWNILTFLTLRQCHIYLHTHTHISSETTPKILLKCYVIWRLRFVTPGKRNLEIWLEINNFIKSFRINENLMIFGMCCVHTWTFLEVEALNICCDFACLQQQIFSRIPNSFNLIRLWFFTLELSQKIKAFYENKHLQHWAVKIIEVSKFQ